MTVLNIFAYIRASKIICKIFYTNKHLTYVLARREIIDRYVGQVMGGVWAILHPILQLFVYWFLFSVVFKVRIGVQPGMPSDYFLYILSGMAPWLFFSEAVNKGPVSITSQSSLVKQVVFPIEVLPLKSMLSSALPFCVMGTLLIIYKIILQIPIFPGLLLLPVALLLQMVLITGLNLLFGALGVYVRDVKDFIQAVTIMIIYIMPMFYLPDMVPAEFRPILSFNPLSHLIWCWQDVFFFNAIAHPLSWLVCFIMAAVVFGIGSRCFIFLRTYFGNVL